MFDLLLQRPEQEQLLLSLLVNKLGDPEAKVTSKATFFLLKLGQLREGSAGKRPKYRYLGHFYKLCLSIF